MQVKQYCKRILYKLSLSQDKPNVLLGLITSEDSQFVKVKTSRREIMISKEYIVSIESTYDEFIEDHAL